MYSSPFSKYHCHINTGHIHIVNTNYGYAYNIPQIILESMSVYIQK